jgi:predicted metalloprotease with PDZ domain
MDFLFSDYLEGHKDYLIFLAELAERFGLELHFQENPSKAASVFGFKTRQEQGKIIIDKLVPGAPAENAGLCINDEITAINGAAVITDWEQNVPITGPLEISVISMGEAFRRTIYPGRERYLPLVGFRKKDSPTAEQKEAFAHWAGCPF